MSTEDTSTYSKEVFKKLFQYFREQPKEERLDNWSATRGMSRKDKYIYYLHLLPKPLLAYAFGILEYPDAKRLMEAKDNMELHNIHAVLGELRFRHLDDEQIELCDTLQEKIVSGQFDGDVDRELLTMLPLSDSQHRKCFLSDDAFFQQIMTDSTYDNDLYNSIMSHFKPEYVSFLRSFQNLACLHITRYFNQNVVDILEDSKLGEIEPLNPDNIMQHLGFVHEILSFACEQGIQSPYIEKGAYLWQRFMNCSMSAALAAGAELPQHAKFPAVKNRIMMMCKAFQSALNLKTQDQERDELHKALFQTAHDLLAETGQHIGFEEQLLKWFDYQTQYCFQQNKDRAVIKEKSEKTSQQDSMVESGDFICFLAKNLPDSRTGFADMADYDVLCLIGVFDEQACNTCRKYTERFSSLEKPCTVVDVFEAQLNMPNEKLLPLKKEYLDVTKQIQQAGKAYLKICFEEDSYFLGASYQKADSFLEKEGLFLNDLVALSQICSYSCGEKPPRVICNAIDSYWETVIAQLPHLAEITKDENIRKRIQKRAVSLSIEPSSEITLAQAVVSRQKIYENELHRIRKMIHATYDDNIPERSKLFYFFHKVDGFFQEYKKELSQQKEMALVQQCATQSGRALKYQSKERLD